MPTRRPTPDRVFVVHRAPLWVCLAVLFLVLLYLYPTPYRYSHTSGKLVRIHRLTGEAHILTDSGWSRGHY